MKEERILFRTEPSRSTSIAISGAIIIPASVVLIVFLLYLQIMNYESWDLRKNILSLFCILMCISGFFSLISMTKRLWTFCYTVNLTNDRVIAYNLWKQKSEMLYTDIKAIKPCKKGLVSLMLVSKDDNVIRLETAIDDYGKMIEMIRERAVNIEEVDYAGHNKNPYIWENNSGWDYEKGRKIKGKR